MNFGIPCGRCGPNVTCSCGEPEFFRRLYGLYGFRIVGPIHHSQCNLLDLPLRDAVEGDIPDTHDEWRALTDGKSND